jgi:hypothetical protein
MMPSSAQPSFSPAISNWLPNEGAAKETISQIYGPQLKNDGSKCNQKDGKLLNYRCKVPECILHVRICCSKKAVSKYCLKVAKSEKDGKRKHEHTHQDKDDNDSDDEGQRVQKDHLRQTQEMQSDHHHQMPMCPADRTDRIQG